MTAVVATPPRQAGFRLGERSISPSSRWMQYQTPPKQAHGGGFGRGNTVELHGFIGARELNGLQGAVSGGLDANGRYTVRLPGATVHGVPPANLRTVQPWGLAQQVHAAAGGYEGGGESTPAAGSPTGSLRAVQPWGPAQQVHAAAGGYEGGGGSTPATGSPTANLRSVQPWSPAQQFHAAAGGYEGGGGSTPAAGSPTANLRAVQPWGLAQQVHAAAGGYEGGGGSTPAAGSPTARRSMSTPAIGSRPRSMSVPRGPPQQFHAAARGYPAARSPAKAAADGGGFGLGSPVELHGRTGSVQHAGRTRARRGRADRRQVRVLVIGTGYGRMLNPAQYGMLTNAGFQVNMVDGLPNPEESNRSMASCLEQIKAKIDQFAPHVVTAASKGGPYLVRLWETGMWRGPSVLINAHPSCRQLPRDCPIVICQGEEDEFYRVRREAAEALIATGSPDKTLLYWVPSSGWLRQGMRSRHGDTHNMKSLVQNDTLPRLVDAVLDPDGPEVHLVRSWRERLSEGRLQAEARIGYTPGALQRRWQSCGERGLENQKLWDVQRNSDEYRCVEEMVRATPKEPAAYSNGRHAAWTRPIVAIQRIENGPQVHGCAAPYYDSLRMDIEAQGLDFEPGVHTVWTFHGTDSASIDSIVNDSVGLRPDFAGSNGATVWGRGTYLARDARYVGEAGFCGRPAADGTYRMLACLTSIGMPCAADPKHTGLLPYRCRRHRYHSSVDHLSNPEVFVAVQAGAVLPAYVITFR